jgi:hypothetical protein
VALGEEASFHECLVEALEEEFFSYGSVHPRRQMHLFFFECLSSPSVALGEDGLPQVSCFPECHAPIGTRESLPSPSAIGVQHSGKIVFPKCPIFGTRGSM